MASVKDAAGAATGWWESLVARRASIRHLIEAWQLGSRTNGNLYAAAITYFSFLALFPLILLAVSVAGFVLNSHPDTLQSIFDSVSRTFPGSVGDTLNQSIQTAINQRTGVGIVGLVGITYTGLGWVGHLRRAIDAVWGLLTPKHNFVVAKALNLLVLFGLGLGVLLSVGVSVVGNSVTTEIVNALGFEHVSGMALLLRVVATLLAFLGDFVIFWWLLVRLPQVSAPTRVGIQGAAVAAAGFEVLKMLATYIIGRAAQSPTAGPLASLLAIFVWVQLVSRFVLLCASWMAVLTREQRPHEFADGAPPAAADAVVERADPGPAWSTLVRFAAVGAVLGAVLARRERRSHRSEG